jgi:hypothetical protein
LCVVGSMDCQARRYCSDFLPLGPTNLSANYRPRAVVSRARGRREGRRHIQWKIQATGPPPPRLPRPRAESDSRRVGTRSRRMPARARPWCARRGSLVNQPVFVGCLAANQTSRNWFEWSSAAALECTNRGLTVRARRVARSWCGARGRGPARLSLPPPDFLSANDDSTRHHGHHPSPIAQPASVLDPPRFRVQDWSQHPPAGSSH